MVTDYDTVRVREETDPAAEILARLDTRRSEAAAATLVDDEETLGVDALDVHRPGLLGEDHAITVLARQPDEFVCSRCFLVHHRSRYARDLRDEPICRDCA
jgi:hypothetical protein